MIKVEKIINHLFSSISYILTDELWDYCVIIDPGDFNKISEHIGDKLIKAVFLTHTHFDHIYGLNQLLEKFPNVAVFTNDFGKLALANPEYNLSSYHQENSPFIISKPQNVRVIEEGDKILGLSVFFTPGHDPSCLCYQIENFFFSGDAYIPGIKVFTRFGMSDKKQASISTHRIQELSKGLEICAGH